MWRVAALHSYHSAHFLTTAAPLLAASHPLRSVSSAILQLGTAAGFEVLVQVRFVLSDAATFTSQPGFFNFLRAETVAYCGCYSLNPNPQTPLLCRFPDSSDSLDRATAWQVLIYISLSRLSYTHFSHHLLTHPFYTATTTR